MAITSKEITTSRHMPSGIGMNEGLGQNGNYYFRLMDTAGEHGINPNDLDNEVSKRVEKTKARAYKDVKNTTLPDSIKVLFNPSSPQSKSPDAKRLKIAGSYYQEFIKPLLADGKPEEVFRPTPEQISEFCDKISSPDGITFALYYAISKTHSPRRTGSPNTLIDLAEAEMIKQYAIMARSAQELGLNLRFSITDESDMIPNGGPLGFNKQEKSVNIDVAKNLIEDMGASGLVKIHSLRESVVDTLGCDFAPLYLGRLRVNKEKVEEDIAANKQSDLKARCFTFIECLPDNAFAIFGISESEIAAIRNMDRNTDLNSLPPALLRYLMNMTVKFNSVMDLRPYAREKLRANQNEQDQENVVHAGITRNPNRWSFKPHPKRNLGRTINPMHGIALYGDQTKEFIGITEYHQLKTEVEEEGKGRIIKLDGKPVFGLLDNA